MKSLRLKTTTRQYLLLLLLFSNLSCTGQVRIPDGFTETEPPKPFSKEWYSLNNGLNDIGVKIINGKLEANPVKASPICSLNIKGGVLRAINHGEFGGELIYIPDDKPKKPIKIKDGNAKFLFSLNNKIYFMEGLAHLGSDDGALFEIDTTSRPFSCKQIIDFGSSPEAFAIFEDKAFVVTNKYFFAVHDHQKDLIFKDLFWRGLYPNSIAVLNPENIFVGMRGGFAKLDLANKSLKFYKYNNN